MELIALTKVEVASNREFKISFLYESVQRLSPTPAPERLITASIVPSWDTSNSCLDGFQVTSPEFVVGFLTKRMIS